MKTLLILYVIASLWFSTQCLASEPNKSQEEIPCQGVTSVIFNDATLALDKSEIISFSSGTACPVDVDAGRCCLEYAITADRLLQPDKQNNIRVVVINRNMLCGSGYGDYLLFYSCVDGRLKNLLKKYYDGGVKLEENSNSELVVTSAIWQESDSHASPSMNRIELYKWDTKSESFIIEKSEARTREKLNKNFRLSTYAKALQQGWQWQTAPNKWKEPRKFQTPFEKKYDSYLSISHQPNAVTPVAQKIFSPNKAYWFAFQALSQKPILIFNEKNYLIQIALSKDDPDCYVDHLTWINEKLIYIEIWWGQVLGSSFIYDVERETMVYKDMINDGNLPFQQGQQNKKTY
jgi:hypothetical protein